MANQETELKDLKQQRSTIKGQLTRLANYINTDGLICDSEELTERIDRIKPMLDKYEKIYLDIVRLGVEDQQELEIHFADFEATYFNTISKARKLVKDRNQSNNVSNVSSVNVSATESNVRLPQINLPSFYGTYCTWLEFRDAFKALIHDNNQLSKVQKFYYLRSALKGEAACIINSLEICEQNYSIAWDMLVDRFQNLKLIVHNHIKAIFDMPALTKESHTGLRQLLDNTHRHLRCLKALEQPVDAWDTIIIYILSNKFDPATRRDWEAFKIQREVPAMEDMNAFLKHKCGVLECIQINAESRPPSHKYFVNKNQTTRVEVRRTENVHAAVGNAACTCCNKGNHKLFECSSFLKMPIQARHDFIKKLRLCFNCFRSHTVNFCKASGCKTCGKRHNTLLHNEERSVHSNTVDNNVNYNQNDAASATTYEMCNSNNAAYNHSVLLSTIQVLVSDKQGNKYSCKALLDSASTCNLITQKLFNKLKIKQVRVNTTIKGVNQSASHISHKTELNIQSKCTNYRTELTCLIVPNITDKLPNKTFHMDRMHLPEGITLADNTFNECSEIDMLIGADLFWKILCVGQIMLGQTILQKTKFGWVATGSIPPFEVPAVTLSIKSQEFFENKQQLKQVWGDLDISNSLSKDDLACENIFMSTHKRTAEGRFIVEIPFRQIPGTFENSYEIALTRFRGLEKRFKNNPQLQTDYKNFLNEYLTLGHMTEVIHDNQQEGYYLPHHGVYKHDSLTTKLRVVFDATAHSAQSKSLNDFQFTGIKFQNDLFTLLIRFRQHSIVFGGDIQQMFRQVLIKPEHRKFQKILWRPNPNETIKTYMLNTITYGTKSAPYLAMRCLKQLSMENKGTFPEASAVLDREFYVDDLLSGTDTVEKALNIITDLNNILNSAGFVLRKWQSNNKNLLNALNNKNLNTIKDISGTTSYKILGVNWDSLHDYLIYNFDGFCKKERITKRTILSNMARIFDPLGLLSPITLSIKLIIQTLWQDRIGWDESIPMELHSRWLKVKNSLALINNLKISRHSLIRQYTYVELHGYCDASEKGYGACIYLKSKNVEGQYKISLLCARSRVAPLKNNTLPRLELRGAVLVSQMMNQIAHELNIKIDRKYCWSDSQIVLAWIKAEPRRFNIFVANRISQIQNLDKDITWNYVRSRDNPADIASRGALPDDIIKSKLWWSGPNWLEKDEYDNANNKVEYVDEVVASEYEDFTVLNIRQNNEFHLVEKYSSIVKLKRVVAYCFRFQENTKSLRQNRLTGSLSAGEVQRALNALVRLVQIKHFSAEIQGLTDNKGIRNSSKLLPLNPYLDNQKILRVGGRLSNSKHADMKKHPIILPADDHLTILIMRQEHIKQLHCGPNALLSSIRELYWPLKGKILCKQICRECIICFKNKPISVTPQMGQLPASRVVSNSPFHTVGVDYAGPLFLKDRYTRNPKLIKGYIVLFICFTTKAFHLDAVTSLSTEAFLDTFRRFIARRGKPAVIYSDNGSNFVGAHNEIKKFLLDNKTKQAIFDWSSDDNIEWNFIPARSPHFGGLWEAGVKSVKNHLNRIISNANLNYEQLCTVLARIESVLNSRPLTALSDSPDDLSPLTPGHFLIGRPLSALPEASLQELNINRLSKYQHLQKLVQHFWERWNKEYLHELQARSKWKKTATSAIKVGALVLVKESNLLPLQWKLGRIADVHPGRDGIVRVPSVKVRDSVFKRAVTHLCVLPINSTAK